MGLYYTHNYAWDRGHTSERMARKHTYPYLCLGIWSQPFVYLDMHIQHKGLVDQHTKDNIHDIYIDYQAKKTCPNSHIIIKRLQPKSLNIYTIFVRFPSHIKYCCFVLGDNRQIFY